MTTAKPTTRKKAVVKKTTAKKPAPKKPNQRIALASVFLTLPKEGLTTKQIASQVHGKCGGSENRVWRFD